MSNENQVTPTDESARPQDLTAQSLENFEFEYEDEAPEGGETQRHYNPNVTETYPVNTRMSANALAALAVILEDKEYVDEIFSALSPAVSEFLKLRAEKAITSEHRYISSITDAQQMVAKGAGTRRAIKREGSDWQQFIKVGEGEGVKHLRASNFRLKTSELTGLDAIAGIHQAAGVSNRAAYMAPHSGYWFSLQTPRAEADLGLQIALAEHVNQVGYLTNGLAFGAESALVHKMVAEYALRNMVSSTLPAMEWDIFIDNTDIFDIESLAWALAAVIYSKGFPYESPCVDNPKSCTHTNKIMADPRNMQWIDNSRLTDFQRRLMTKRPGGYRSSVEDLAKYRQEHAYKERVKSTYELTANVRAVFGVPNLRRYFTSSDEWLGKIRQMTESAFATMTDGQDVSKAQRIQFMNMQAQLTNLQQYAHFIERLEVLKEDGDWEVEDDVIVYVDTSTIADAIAGLGVNEEIFDSFMGAIENFINNAVMVVIGLPTFECEVCGKSQATPEAIARNHPDVIPVPVFHLFFTLLSRRLFPALNRG